MGGWWRGLTACLALGALAGAPARAAALDLDDELLLHDQPVDRATWPEEITRRPLTLAAGMIELEVPLGVNVSAGHMGQPTFVAPNLSVGMTDGITVSLRHALGLCLSGVSAGCPKVYGDVGLDLLWKLARGDVGEFAFGTALDAAPLDPMTLSGEVRLVARFGGPLALTLAPALRFGFTERDTGAVRAARVAFPLAGYPFGWVELTAGNREYVSVPVSLTFQLVPPLAFALGGALDGPIDSKAGGFDDLYRVPLGAALIYSPFRILDLGASFTFADLLGSEVTPAERWNARGLQLLVAVRY